MTNIHTAHHNKDENSGRSEEIEGYTRKSVDYLRAAYQGNNVLKNNPSFLDLGCDYGYALMYMSRQYFETAAKSSNCGRLVGIERYPSTNPFDMDIREGDMASEDFSDIVNGYSFDMIMLNHTLEHVENPHAVARNLKKHLSHGGVIFIAVPEATTDWALWEGHESVWTTRFMKKFMEQHGFKALKPPVYRCFRGQNVEIWGVFTHA